METLSTIFTNKDFLTSIPLVILLIVAIAFIGKAMHLKIHTKHFTIGGEHRASVYERKIIQEQCDFAHEYITGLVDEFKSAAKDKVLQYGGWFAKYILEIIYDEVVCWIVYNHISEDEAYIKVKQSKVKAVFNTFDVLPELKTPEFYANLDKWVKDIIHELIRIRSVNKVMMEKGL